MSFGPNADLYGSLGLIKNPDGSFTRSAPADPTNPFHFSKDITINQRKNTWARLFLPRKSFAKKLPIVVYFHGGGFVATSAVTPLYYNLYNPIIEIPAILITVEYRLAPEHRLPAAYDDGMEMLHWIKNSTDEWLTKYCDVSNCFLLGSSSGGNIAYHVGLRAASSTNALKPLEIKGLIMHYPYFGGVERTESEIRLKDDKVLPLRLNDLAWDLSLPMHANRDYKYSNPVKGMNIDVIERIKLLKWKILLVGYYGDPLIDRQIIFVKKLEKLGVSIISIFDKGSHGVDVFDPSKREVLINQLKEIIRSSNCSSIEMLKLIRTKGE